VFSDRKFYLIDSLGIKSKDIPHTLIAPEITGKEKKLWDSKRLYINCARTILRYKKG